MPNPKPDPPRPAGPHRVALLVAAFTWPLLLVGGTVTVYRFGMAVPDWPTTFGINMFVYNFWNAARAVQVEHAHRLFGALVGLACIVLAAWLALADRRRWMKGLGLFALAAVIGQGVLGGLRVRLNSPTLAFVHGCTAEAFFALTVALCVLTGRRWAEARRDAAPLPRRVAAWAGATLALVYGQVVAGAFVRHFGGAVAVHATLAAVVWLDALALAWWSNRHRAGFPRLLPSALTMAGLTTAQAALGAAAWWVLRPFDGIPRAVPAWQALLRIGHQGVGALLLAAAVVLALRAARGLCLGTAGAARQATASPRTLEAVA